MGVIDQIKSTYPPKNNIYYLTEPLNTFEDIYINVRKAEGRIYDDSEVRLLPEIGSAHRYYKEWRKRKLSMQMLASYLNTKQKNRAVLELGCGNGWISNKLAELGFVEVIGMDVNVTELEQAARVFSEKNNLIFIYGDIFRLKELSGFDYIILSSAIAYFEDLKKLVDTLQNMLKPGGEIHIIDSPFYKDTAAAHERTIKYYNELGFPEMAEHYHHHLLEELKSFNYSILYNPETIINKIKRRLNSALSPFYWVKITTQTPVED